VRNAVGSGLNLIGLFDLYVMKKVMRRKGPPYSMFRDKGNWRNEHQNTYVEVLRALSGRKLLFKGRENKSST